MGMTGLLVCITIMHGMLPFMFFLWSVRLPPREPPGCIVSLMEPSTAAGLLHSFYLILRVLLHRLV